MSEAKTHPALRAQPRILRKSLRYSVAAKFVNFDLKDFSTRTIIVDGSLAIRIKGRVYTKI